ncbi:MAG TPA: porin [Burkholderiales bacterium]|nr:porin [Burkholderiales bacterium]
MNKKLLTVAIGAALAAGPMLAQADVKLYGKVHMSVDWFNPGDKGAGNDASSRKNTQVSSNASRWGLDISEKLGGGLTAIAKLEQAIYADGESNDQTSHARWVGVSGKFGQVTAGIHESQFKLIGRAVELFPDYIGDARNITVMGATVAAQPAYNADNNGSIGWEQRPPNSVQYITPSLNGFKISYLYSADSTAVSGTEDNRRRLDDIAATYAKGPLYVGFSRQTHRSNSIADSGNPTETGDRLGASYNFGAFKLVALWQNLKDLGGTAAGATSVNRKAWGLGGAYTAGNNVFKVQYYKAGALSNTSTGASGDNTGAKMWTLGWDHLFSKTTRMYVAYAKTDNDSSARFLVNGPALNARSDFVTPNAGGDPSAWSVGMVVDF